jgi:hypothetical protein
MRAFKVELIGTGCLGTVRRERRYPGGEGSDRPGLRIKEEK